MPQIIKKIIPKDYKQAYEYRARYFKDPYMMSGRGKWQTTFKTKNIIKKLKLNNNQKILDIGCGDGTLFKLIHNKVKKGYGIDPSEIAIKKLKDAFIKRKSIEFKVGLSSKIPYPKNYFDIIVINSVIHILPSKKEVEKTLREIKRVSKKNAQVYIGEIPHSKEAQEKNFAKIVIKKIKELGMIVFIRTVMSQYIGQILKGKPLIVEPMHKTIYYPPNEFLRLCEKFSMHGTYFSHIEASKKPSTTRNDFLLTQDI